MNDAYQKRLDALLDAEARALRSAQNQAGLLVDDVIWFRSAGPIETVADRFIEVLGVLNANVATIPADADQLVSEDDFTRLDKAWRPLFPYWLTRSMAVLPPTDAQVQDPQFQRHVIFARWLSQFARAHRYCFYAGHALSGDALSISVTYSEHPAPNFEFTDLVEKCGGVPTEGGFDPKPAGVLNLLRQLSRKKH